MAFVLKNETKFLSGESECQCGGSEFSPFEVGPLAANLQSAETLDLSEEEEDVEDFDWCRPGPDDSLEGDYNNIFDDDPSFGK